MTLYRRNRLPLFAAAALLSACNLGPGTGGGDDDDDAVGDDDDDAGGEAIETTIQAINAGEHEEGDVLTITGAIVTSDIVEDDDFRTLWVQDNLGGPGGGLTIATFADVLEVVDPDNAMFIGDIVDITGTFQRMFDEEIPRLRVDNAAGLTITGYTDPPDAHLVDATDIAGGFAAENLWGLPVAVEDVTVETRPTFDNFGVFTAAGIKVDDEFYWADVEVGYELGYLAGILTPWYGEVTLMPRWDDDVWYEPAGCDAVPESEDDSLPQINCRRYWEGETVDLTGLTVISAEFRTGNIFLQDLDAPAFGGVQFYDPSQPPTIPAVGAVVDLSGVQYEEFNGQTELAAWDDGSITDTGATNDITPTEVADACSIGEAHEGTLVTIPSVTLTEQTEWAEGRGYYPVDGCDTAVMVGSLFYDDAEAFDAVNGGVGTITNLTGVVSDRFEVLFINPRSDDDWDEWTAADR